MIHPTAVIDPKARLGVDVSVGAFTCIQAHVEIGDRCVLGPHVSVLEYTRLGEGCVVHDGAVLGDTPQDLHFKGGESWVHIGAGCHIREGVTIHRGTDPGSVTTIGNRCFLMANSHCAHNVTLGDEVILANGTLLGGHVQIGERAFVSGNCLLHQFVRIGRLAMLGGGCGVSKDVPPFCLVIPMTRNRVGGLNVVGLRRAGFTPDQRLQVKRAFHTLYQSGLSVTQAVSQLRAAGVAGPVEEFVAFVETSKRGICGPDAESGDESE